ncbi:hypothetical protein ACFV1C_09715 [Streptomyces sp. NPDC059605]|uniref:hypothetical protein n=1 Tax=unclassified Streptomyces TaxID=2593676 RepID=UPI0036BD6C0A
MIMLGGLVPGDQQQHAERGRLAHFQRPVGIVAPGDQPTEQIALWFGDPLPDQLAEVRLQPLAGRAPADLVRLEAHQHLAVELEHLVVLVRHPEHLADHLRGDRQGEVPHQIGTGPGEHRVDVLVGDLLDAGS